MFFGCSLWALVEEFTSTLQGIRQREHKEGHSFVCFAADVAGCVLFRHAGASCAQAPKQLKLEEWQMTRWWGRE